MRFFSEVILIKSTSCILHTLRKYREHTLGALSRGVIFQLSSYIEKGEATLRLAMRLGGVSGVVK